MALPELIAPALVSAAVTAVLAPLLFFLLKKRDERKRRQFDLRYAEYKKCLQVLEEIAVVARVDLKQACTGIVESALKDVLADPDPSRDYSVRVEQRLAALGTQLRESFARVTSGLHGSGLICSDELQRLISEFVNLQRELVEESISVIADASISNPSPSVTGALNERAKRADALFGLILEQMRSELDVRGAARPEG
jgi:hypothetical protein